MIDPKVLTGELDDLRAKGDRPLRAAHQRQRAPDHALPPAARPRGRGAPRQAADRHHAPRHRPRYADKAARLGIRVQDLLDEKILKKKIAAAMEPKRLSLRPFAKSPELDLQSMTEDYLTYGHRIEQYIADTARLAWDALDADGNVIFEGAQGTLLDIDHGTYPFVTSSNPVAGARLHRHRRRPEGHRRDLGHRQGLRHPRRRRPVPDRARRRARRADPRGRRRVRHHHRPRRAGSAGSTSWRCATPRASTRSPRLVHHQARRAHRARPAVGLHRATAAATRRVFDDYPYHQTVLHHATGEYEELPGLGRGHHRLPRRVASCRRPRATTSPSSRTSSACRSR